MSAIYVDSDFADGTFGATVPFDTVDGGHSGTASLAPGNVVVVDITVSNTPLDVIQSMFASLTVQGDDFAWNLGTVLPPTMLKLGDSGQSLEDIGSTGTVKSGPNTFGSPGDVWIQALSYALFGGASGAGPDTVQIYLILGAGVTANETITFDMRLTPGDSIAGPGPIATTFISASINGIPEPGTALLMGLGLAGLALRRN